MTDTELRDLLQDRVAGLITADLAPAAWREAVRRRTRRRIGAVAGVAAGVLAVVGVVGVIAAVDERTAQHPGHGPASSAPTPSGGEEGAAEPPRATRVGDYRGARVWEAPPAEVELDLPRWPEPSLPEVLDPTTAGGGLPGTPVRGLLTEGPRVFALSGAGALTELDVSRLEPVRDEGGNRVEPVSPYSLSPDGARAFFVQHSTLEVLELRTGRWQTLDTPDWSAEGARWATAAEIWVPESPGSGGAGTIHHLDGSLSRGDARQPRAWSGEETWGPVAARSGRVAQDMFLAGPVEGTGVSNPEAVVVRTGERVDVLSMWPDPPEARYKGCCGVLGFLDDDTVMFASESTEGYRLLAWRVGTEDVYLVSRLAGPGTLVAWLPAG